MVILKSIGAFFVKIWHWIKETAWVQPLLIVGAIFAVIFSIPYITEWVGGWTGNGAGAFYEASLLTLEGQTLSGDVTAADRFANVLEANEEKISEGKYDEIDTESYGEKFFFVVWKEDCTACETAESGLRYLSDNWGYYDLIPAISGESFKMYTIDASQESANDDDKEYTDMGTAPSASHRLTAWRDTPSFSPNPAWDRPSRSRCS